MLVCATATGPSLDADIDPRFGRCSYFLFINTDDMTCEPVGNEGASASGGAGIQAAQAVINKGARAVLTGRVGPNAMDVFQSSDVKLFPGLSGPVREAVSRYKEGSLRPDEAASGAGFGRGTGGGRGGGRGMGCGRGMGRGRGMGGGQGMGMGRGMSYPGETSPMSRAEELAWLKQDANLLQEQLDAIKARIDDLEGE